MVSLVSRFLVDCPNVDPISPSLLFSNQCQLDGFMESVVCLVDRLFCTKQRLHPILGWIMMAGRQRMRSRVVPAPRSRVVVVVNRTPHRCCRHTARCNIDLNIGGKYKSNSSINSAKVATGVYFSFCSVPLSLPFYFHLRRHR